MKLSLGVLALSVLIAVLVAGFGGPGSGDDMVVATAGTRAEDRSAVDGTQHGAPDRTRADDAPARPDTVATSTSTVPVHSGSSALEPSTIARPERVRVPTIDLDVAIVPVGVDEHGLFDVPHVDEVGWYQFGPSPGEPGAAVLAAHVDYNGHIGAFFELSLLEVGDRIHLDYSDGSEQAFEVVEQVLYDKDSLPADDLFRRGGDPGLHLVTCGGVFDPVVRSYRGNRVVSAVPVALDSAAVS